VFFCFLSWHASRPDERYALKRPELGLSNWEGGRLFGRGGVLSGDSVFTARTRVTQSDPAVRR
jgi:glutamate-5-semialdehyde dehydrogenase